MLIRFFTTLRQHGLPVTPKDLIALHEVMEANLAACDMDAFYHLSRMTLVKDETRFDRFDQAFAHFQEGLEAMPDPLGGEFPEDWLRLELDRHFSEEEKRQIEAFGGLEALMKALEERLNEQTGRHEGGNRWIGTGGTSPFGHGGYNPEGIRIGGPGRHRRAVKVWEQRRYRNLDDESEIGSRNIQLALRKLRRFARSGAREELDLDATIRDTARNAGLLDIRTRPERHNAVKVLSFFDVGGSMDDHVQLSEALFTACRAEFKHLEHYYFHNFIYEHLWQANELRHDNLTPLDEILNTYGPDYKAIFVGDASMSPYEIAAPFGAIDFMNPEPGAASFEKIKQRFERLIWLNPVPEEDWERTYSIGMVRELLDGRMFPLTVEGLERAITCLQTGKKPTD
ncbi:VWA domain-containing protein [Gammaproteobacteria bacterium AB-CW1]|uniref:VWA domain-containing protein n=1 Tax=Natronospira elongata TaxID=3110268 RepID=A0AAP6JGQ5_9GAMM|nr:VWA domain-containing protein [Gammaproteobacteria bacterium AB-CW1]